MMAWVSFWHRGLAVLGVVWLAGCGEEDRTTLDGLTQPILVWRHGYGLCDSTRAVDGDDQVWDDHGCESPTSYHLKGRASPGDVQALRDAMRAAFTPNVRDTCAGDVHEFELAIDGIESVVCSVVPFAPDSRPREPYAALTYAFDRLVASH